MGEPVFLALLTADRVITEKNDKKGIIGTFNRLASPDFPATFQTWWIYASATNLLGSHEFRIDITPNNAADRLFSAKGELTIPHASQIVEVAVPVVGCSFPEPARYTVHFILNDYQLGARVLRVDRIVTREPEAGGTG